MTDEQMFWNIVRMALIQITRAVEKYKLKSCKSETTTLAVIVETPIQPQNAGATLASDSKQ